MQLWTRGGFRRRRLLRAEQDDRGSELDERRKWELHHGLVGDVKYRPGFYEATLAIKNDERVRPTDDTSGKSNGVSGEGEGAMMNVGSGRDDEGSNLEEDSDEEMVADAQEGEHVEPSAVAGEEPDRDQEDLHGDEEAPARNARNPKDPLPEERELHNKRGHLPYRAWCPVREGHRQGGPA